MAARILWTLLALAELALLLVALIIIQTFSPTTALVVGLAFCLLGLFAAFTGRGLPRLRGRIKGALVFVVAGFVALIASLPTVPEREARWADLRETAPEAYLAELAPVDQERWLDELRLLRPDSYALEVARLEEEAETHRQAAAEETARRAEAERQAAQYRAEAESVAAEERALEAETARLHACTDANAGEAYVMMQADVRRMLVAPSTAEFPGRHGAGTRHLGDCLYHVNGHFDAQNGFGAMLRGTFSGTIRHFPETRSWQTQSLGVD